MSQQQQLPSTPTSLGPLSPTPLSSNSSSFFMQQHYDGLISPTTTTTPLNGINGGKEEISTIFVVGFPEDMQEREFQNMFMFSPGFEAATLKVPSAKDVQDDDYLMNNNNGRKQIIGFAKFRTRKEAIDARDVLNGRKVDVEKGCMLKAEMAKKNLHTKRGLLNEQQAQQQLQAQQQMQQQLQFIQQSTTSSRLPQNTNSNSTYEAFYSVPQNVLQSPSATETSFSDFYSDLPMLVGSPPPPPSSLIDLNIARSQSVDIRSTNSNNNDLFVLQPSMSTSRFSNRFNQINNREATSSSLYDNLDYLSKSTPINDRSATAFRTMNSFFLQQHHSSSHHQSLQQQNGISNNNNKKIASSITTTNNNNGMEEFFLQQQPPPPLSLPLTVTTSSPPISSSSSTASPPPPPPPPGILSPTTSYRSLGGMLVGSSNPADQNPPCNTLYVGNLPPNTNEEELKNMFCKCPGYKRLSFRNKSNGPMCFVEFDDAIYAAQALQDLHGNPLSNSIKGGIRLSFSKNPLGVRQNPTTTTTNNNGNYPINMFNNRRESITTNNNFDPQLI